MTDWNYEFEEAQERWYEEFENAIINGKLNKVKNILKKSEEYDFPIEDNSALMMAIEHGQDQIAKELIKYGSDIDCNENEPIVLACEYGRIKIVKLLISKGADVSARDHDPILKAIEFVRLNKNGFIEKDRMHEHEDMVKLMLQEYVKKHIQKIPDLIPVLDKEYQSVLKKLLMEKNKIKQPEIMSNVLCL